jgi:hypothetical protein
MGYQKLVIYVIRVSLFVFFVWFSGSSGVFYKFLTILSKQNNCLCLYTRLLKLIFFQNSSSDPTHFSLISFQLDFFTCISFSNNLFFTRFSLVMGNTGTIKFFRSEKKRRSKGELVKVLQKLKAFSKAKKGRQTRVFLIKDYT